MATIDQHTRLIDRQGAVRRPSGTLLPLRSSVILTQHVDLPRKSFPHFLDFFDEPEDLLSLRVSCFEVARRAHGDTFFDDPLVNSTPGPDKRLLALF